MKHIYKLTLLCIATITIIGCTKTEYVYIPQEGGGDNETETKSIVGVWQWQQDSLIFLSFDPWGTYAYVLGQNLMASGSYTFDGTTVHMSNTMHGGRQETLTITFANNDPSKIDGIDGDLYIWGAAGESYNRNVWLYNFRRVNRPYHSSLAGTEYSLGISEPCQINGTWYDGNRFMQYTSSSDAKNVLKIKKNGSWQEHSSTNQKYIYRSNIIYRQSSKGDGKIYTYSLSCSNGDIVGETGYSGYAGYPTDAISDNAYWW